MKMSFDKDIYFQYNPWWQEVYQPSIIKRETLERALIEALNDHHITLLTGLRRVGKTTLMKAVVSYLLAKNIKPQHIFYVSCDDYLLRSFSLMELMDHFRQIHRISVDEKVYVFFDEITFKEDFQIQLKNLHDLQNVKVFASSSSSSALRDKRGYLTGRQRVIEITPLTFDEFLYFRNIQIKLSDKKLLSSYFEDYMKVGGMPEYVLNNDREYLTSLVDDILYKDIVSFHGIRNPAIIADFFVLLMERAGKQISINKMARILSISVDSARRYLQLFLDTFLIYLVPRYGKTNETLLSAQKVYAADIGIRNLYVGFRDKGAIFENIVFSLIKSKKPRYVYQDGIEIDFMTQDKTLIEVKYHQVLNDKQKLLFDVLPAKKKLVITSFEDLKLL